jgi:hypothetical protein
MQCSSRRLLNQRRRICRRDWEGVASLSTFYSIFFFFLKSPPPLFYIAEFKNFIDILISNFTAPYISSITVGWFHSHKFPVPNIFT